MANKPVDGVAAANTMLGFGTWRKGHCLEAVWSAYRDNGAQDITGQREPTAYDAWLHTNEEDRRYSEYDDIPAGVPVWFGPKSGSRAGDVVISVGGGYCIATDIPGRPGVIGRMKIETRQRQINRPYLGWSTTILDWPISFAQSGGGSTPTPEPTPNPAPESEEDDEMYFTFVQGKAESHRSGVFAHMRDNKGVWFAKRLNFDAANTQGLPVIANTQLESWQGTMRFLDL